MIRLRAIFSKTEAMRFTGHLDLQRTLERSIRRANLPLVYSQGFTPRPKLTLASALPLGYTSEYEVADLWLKYPLTPEQAKTALDEAAPPGIQFQRLEQIRLDAPQLQTQTLNATYLVKLPEAFPELEQRLSAMLAAENIPLEKLRKGKKKVSDLRHLILAAELLEKDSDGLPCLKLKLRTQEGATGRPDDVLAHLGIDPLQTRVHRLAIEFKTPGENS